MHIYLRNICCRNVIPIQFETAEPYRLLWKASSQEKEEEEQKQKQKAKSKNKISSDTSSVPDPKYR